MKRSLAILTCSLLLGFASPLLAQDRGALEAQAAQLQEQGPALRAFLQRSRDSQVDPAMASEVLRGAKALEDQGLPAEPYLLKANEGLAKRVAPRKMAPALDQTVARTRSAAALVDQSFPGADPQSRRKAILRAQSGLMSGEAPKDVERKLRVAPKDKETETTKGNPKGEIQKPPKKSPGFEKPEKRSKPQFQKPEKGPKAEKGGGGRSQEKPRNFNGKSGGKSGGKGRGK